MVVRQLIRPVNQSRPDSDVGQLIKSGTLEFVFKCFIRDSKLNGLSDKTIADYEEKVGKLLAFLHAAGLNTVDQVKSDHIKDYLIERMSHMKAVSAGGYFRCAKRFFNYMVSENFIAKSPMLGMKAPKVPNVIINPLTPKHINDLLFLCDDKKFLGARNKAIILTLLDTGLRLHELDNIRVKDIYSDDMLTMSDRFKVLGKGAKERFVAISLKTQKAINQYMKLRNSDLPELWLSEERRPLTGWGIYRAISKLGKLAKITDVRFNTHNYRHTCATMSLENGANVYEVQSLLGHSTLEMTRRYVSSLNSSKAADKHKKFSPVDHLK